jgi:hypothetical protein
MARNIALVVASFALLILSLAALAAATQPARAQSVGPAFSGGTFPLLSFAGTDVALNNPPTAIYTVPAGKKFVVRTFCLSSSSWHMGRNGATVGWNTLNRVYGDNEKLYCKGEGQFVYDAGDTLDIRTTTSSTSLSGDYVIEGTLMTE